jgi:23S rRNA pseudouridine1911/1915/1917 synthase
VLERYFYKNNNYALLKLELETGRTHQIRVHLAHLGRPVIGDKIYGLENINKNFSFLNGQCLHSKALGFIHPASGEHIYIESELPEHFKKVLDLIRG